MSRLHPQLKLIIAFLILIGFSFISDYLHTFLGDWYCNGGKAEYDGHIWHYSCLYLNGTHEPTWHYGFRHWVLIAMGFTFFIWNILLIKKHK